MESNNYNETENHRVVSGGSRFSGSRKVTFLLILVVILAGLIAINAIKQTEVAPTVQPAFTRAQTSVVTITANGFVPSILKIKKDTIVSWKNTDTVGHSVLSGPHPEHSDLSDLNSGPLVSGQSYQYKFTKSGSFYYHDEQKLTTNATIVVE